MKKLRVGVLGATGMVGQRALSLLATHPWFEVTVLAASPSSAGKSYREAVQGRWAMPTPIPAAYADMTVQDASVVAFISERADFVFCAVDMSKDATAALEEAYARSETPVVSNNSAHRWTPDVPVIVPEVNAHHAHVIDAQRRRLGTQRGFITAKPNCSIQSYVPALHPLWDLGVTRVAVCTYQALSGAGKTLASWPEMNDNVIPFIKGEEEKSESEPLKIWGVVEGGAIQNAAAPIITAQCLRVPVSDGHMAAVFMSLAQSVGADEILARWQAFRGTDVMAGLPSAPVPPLVVRTEDDRPQTRLDRGAGAGQSISVGRLRKDSVFDWKFVALSHNTVRGAAGGSVLTAELLTKMGYLSAK